MIVFPLILNVNFWKKVILIVLNYISFFLFMFGIVWFFSESDFDGKFALDLAQLTPSREYTYNNSKLSQSRIYADEKYFMLIGIEKKQGLINYFNAQFVDVRLHNLCIKKKVNDNLRNSIILDSLLCLQDKSKVSKKDSLKSKLYKEEINIKLLDSFKNLNLTDYKKDVKVCDSLATHSKFKSNQEYYKKFKLHLIQYGESYTDNNKINKIYLEAKSKMILNVKDDLYVTVLTIDTTKYDKTNIEYYDIKKKMDKRDRNANLVAAFLFDPFDKILDFYGYYD
ncbi:hypothetical protein [Flavobacterium sp. CGRL2]